MRNNSKYLAAVAFLAIWAVGFSLIGTVVPAYELASPQRFSSSLSPSSAHTPQIFDLMVDTAEWNKTYGRESTDIPYSTIQTSDGGYALAGQTITNGGYSDFFLVKTDSTGTMLWNKTYGGASYYDYCFSVVQTSDGGYALAGTTLPRYGYPDFLLVKTDSIGTMLWNKTYGVGGSSDVAESVIRTIDGGYALAGYGFANLVKTDADGNQQWTKAFGGVARSVVQTEDGGYVLAGSKISDPYGYSNFWLVKTDAVGTLLWSKTYGGAYDDIANSMVQTSDGGYALAGYATGTGDDFLLVKTDAVGTLLWSKAYGGEDTDIANSLVQTKDGGYALAGYTTSYGNGSADFWLIKTDSTGNKQWNKTYGGTGYDDARTVIQTSDGGYALAGDTDSYGVTGADFWLIKIPPFPGDVNADGVVNILDAAAVSAHWYPGPPIGSLGYDSNFDIDKDGKINVVDVAIVSAYWTGPPKGPQAP